MPSELLPRGIPSRAVLYAAALCLLVGAPACALPLTLGEAVRRALQRGFEMEIQSYDLAMARDRLVDARSAFDPRLSVTLGKSVSRTAADALRPGASSEGLASHVGVSQSLATGASLGVAVNVDRSRLNPAIAAMSPAYASGVTLALRQPLLKGFGSSISRAGIRTAEVGLESSMHGYQARALDVVRAAEASYHRLAGAREELLVLRASLELASRLQSEAQSRRTAGMATKLDVLQAQVGVSRAREAVALSQSVAASAEDALLALTGRFELEGSAGEVTLEGTEPDAAPDAAVSYGRALRRQPELLDARAALELARLDIALTRNALRPSVDLDLALGLGGDGGGARGALQGALESERSSWQAGFSLNYTLGRAGERARHRQASAELRRRELALQLQEQGALVQVREAVRTAATQRQAIGLAVEAVRVSEEQLEYQHARFRAGLATSRNVLEAQVDLQEARLSLVRARLALCDAAGNLRRLEGSALDHYGIELAAP